jgi:hypothetical protein
LAIRLWLSQCRAVTSSNVLAASPVSADLVVAAGLARVLRRGAVRAARSRRLAARHVGDRRLAVEVARVTAIAAVRTASGRPEHPERENCERLHGEAIEHAVGQLWKLATYENK